MEKIHAIQEGSMYFPSEYIRLLRDASEHTLKYLFCLFSTRPIPANTGIVVGNCDYVVKSCTEVNVTYFHRAGTVSITTSSGERYTGKYTDYVLCHSLLSNPRGFLNCFPPRAVINQIVYSQRLFLVSL